MFCKHCGKIIDADSNFCTHCGGIVSQEQKVPVVQLNGYVSPPIRIAYGEGRSAKAIAIVAFLMQISIFFWWENGLNDRSVNLSIIENCATVFFILSRLICINLITVISKELGRKTLLPLVIALLFPGVTLFVIASLPYTKQGLVNKTLSVDKKMENELQEEELK